MLPQTTTRPVKGWEISLTFVVALAALNWGIPAFFGAMPLLEQFGRFICRTIFGL